MFHAFAILKDRFQKYAKQQFFKKKNKKRNGNKILLKT